MPREALFISVRPTFAERLLRGTKTVELRRVRPNVREGQTVILYASSPVKALVGTAVVESVTVASPETMWPTVAPLAGVSIEEFFGYFAGAALAVAIRVRHVVPLAVPIPLYEIRRRWPWLRPPQSFCFVMLDGNEDHPFALAPRPMNRGTVVGTAA